MYACLAVTCYLHFWQNDRDFLRATVVTRGWNGYRNKSQHRKSTLEKKILPPFQQGFEPATFQSRVRRSNHWAIPAPFTMYWNLLSMSWPRHNCRCRRTECINEQPPRRFTFSSQNGFLPCCLNAGVCRIKVHSWVSLLTPCRTGIHAYRDWWLSSKLKLLISVLSVYIKPTQIKVTQHNNLHTHTHSASDDGIGRAVKNSLEIIIKQVRLEGGFKRGGRIRVAECLRQTVRPGWLTRG